MSDLALAWGWLFAGARARLLFHHVDCADAAPPSRRRAGPIPFLTPFGFPRSSSLLCCRILLVVAAGTSLLLLLALLVRYGVSGGGHSGMAVPPMYGDYEAQRSHPSVATQDGQLPLSSQPLDGNHVEPAAV